MHETAEDAARRIVAIDPDQGQIEMEINGEPVEPELIGYWPARTPTPQSQVMSKVSNPLPLTIPLDIPAYWTPEQAFAVVELLEQLRDCIWAHYGVQLIDQYREQYGPTDSDHPDETTDNPSF